MSSLGEIGRLAELFGDEGAREYLGEPVSMAEHMLQAATLAEGEGRQPALVAACLLHDVGHFTGLRSGRELMEGRDNHHAETGGAWLAPWLGEAVSEPVRLHVAAKRYLCSVDPAYLQSLSPASTFTLQVQGGPMDDAEARAFERVPHFDDALALRRLDEAAKDPALESEGLEHFLPLLERLARGHLSGRGA